MISTANAYDARRNRGLRSFTARKRADVCIQRVSTSDMTSWSSIGELLPFCVVRLSIFVSQRRSGISIGGGGTIGTLRRRPQRRQLHVLFLVEGSKVVVSDKELKLNVIHVLAASMQRLRRTISADWRITHARK